MSSIIRTGGSNIDRSAELRGLSTDTKPTRANGNEVPHGSIWYNMDDSTKYMYNADNDTWYNIPNGGGGGTGDMQKSVYDPTNTVANAGGIDTYVETEIGDATTEIINTVNSNIGTISDNLIKDTVGWTNKNLLPITLSSLQEINTNGTWDDNVYTYRNITITVETDIYNLITDIKVNGANTAGSVAFKLTNNFVYQLLSEDKYYISDGVDVTAIVDGSAYISVERKKGESGESHYLSTNNENRSTKFTVDYATYDYYSVSIYIPNNSSINNAVFYPMIRRASISDATYEPYRSTVEDELNSIDSAIGTLNANLGIANSRITNLQNNKANKSDLGTSAYKNSTSVVTDSSDLVESGAVKDIIGWGNKNLLPNNAESITTKGITFTVNSDSSVTANGTCTQNVDFYYSGSADSLIPLGNIQNGDILNGCTGGSANTYSIVAGNLSSSYGTCTDGDVALANIASGIRVVIRVKQGATLNNVVFKPMIRKADVTDDTYEPHHESVEEYCASKEDVKDIVGWGNKNLCNPYTFVQGLINHATGNVGNNNQWITSDYIPCSGMVTISGWKDGNESNFCVRFAEYDSNKNFIKCIADVNTSANAYYSRTITLNSGTRFVRITQGFDNKACTISAFFAVNRVQLEKGSTATAYEPYHESVEKVLHNVEVTPCPNLANPDKWYADYISVSENNGEYIITPISGSYPSLHIYDNNYNDRLMAGKTYTIYVYCVSKGTNNPKIAFRDKANNQVLGPSINLAVGINKLTITLTVDAYASIFPRFNNTDASTIIVKNIMLYYGDGDVEYVPFYQPLKERVRDVESVIAPTENGTTVQKSDGYAIGSHAIRNGAFITWKNAKAQGETINDESDYTSGAVGDFVTIKYFYGQKTVAANSYLNLNIPTITGYTPVHVTPCMQGAGVSNTGYSKVVYSPTDGTIYSVLFNNTDSSNHPWTIAVYVTYVKDIITVNVE